MNVKTNGSKFEALSSEAKSTDGLRPHGLLCDELHAWREPEREFREKLFTALGKRRQPLAIDITTAGNDESDLWQEQYDWCRMVVDPSTVHNDDRLFVLIYEIDDDDDELDASCWPKANPMLEFGVVKGDHIEGLANQAAHNPIKRAELRRYHCNKFTTSVNKPITPEVWAKGNQPLPDLSGKKCFCGFDWGWRDDLAALGSVFPLDWVKVGNEHKRTYAIDADVWCVKHGPRDLQKSPWREWIDGGYLRVTDSEHTDPNAIYKRVAERQKKYQIQTIAYDPNNAREFASNCVNEYGLKTFDFWQTHKKYNEPLREFVIALREGRIIHGGNPLLEWVCVQNFVTNENAEGLLMPSKKRSPDKIDPLVAILMAFSEAIFAEQKQPGVYERRGPLVFG